MAAPSWFIKKVILRNTGYTFLFLIIGVVGSYYLSKVNLIIGLVFFGTMLIGAKAFIDNMDKRGHGLIVEKEAYEFLKNNTNFDIEFRKELDSGGDIDIYIKDLDIAIDVKAYRKIDKRIFSSNNVRSYNRQRNNSDRVVIWLPNAEDTVKYNKNFNITIIGGKNTMLNYLNKKSREIKNS